MHIRTRMLMAALTAALVLAFAVTTASALRSLSVNGATTVSLSGVITFEGAIRVECPTTIVRVISAVIPKVAGVLLGFIREIITERPNRTNCRTSIGTLNEIRILGRERAECYRLYFNGIEGRLPIITAIDKEVECLIIGFVVTEPFGGRRTCLYEERVRAEGTRGRAIEELNERQQFTRMTLGRNIALITPESSAGCPTRGELIGRANVTNVPPPTIVLI